jgi:hypothetical protein
MMISVEQSVEWELEGETEILGKNLSQCHFVHHKFHWPDMRSNPGRRVGKSATNRLSYGTAVVWYIYIYSRVSGVSWRIIMDSEFDDWIY